MNKNKRKRLVESFLNQALEVIYLLTGEEYTIVKKNSPHSSIHQLTGEVPIKYDDVAVYFSMEEWEYIEEHKERYKDVMMEEQQIINTLEPSADVTTGTVSILKDGESDQDQETRQTGSKTGLPEENQETESFSDHINNEKGGEEFPQAEICQDHGGGEMKEDTDDPHVESPIEAQEQEVLQYIASDGSMRSMIEESSAAVSLSDIIVIEDSTESQRIKEEDFDCNLPNESDSCDIEDPPPPPVLFYQNEQKIQHIDKKLVEGNHVGSYRTMAINNPECAGINKKITYDDVGTQNIGTTRRINTQDLEQLTSRLNSQHNSHNITYICPECGKCFTKKSSLVTHYKAHTGEKPYSCYECGKFFIKRANMVAHHRTHTKEKPHACPDCGKCFTKKSSLVMHHKTHTGEKPFACLECGKCFIKRSNLDNHHRTHTNEKPHVCPDCGKGFTLRSYLDKHHRTHTGEKPYACPDCGKCFTQRTHMVIHQRTHTGVKPYVCPECGKGFTRRTHMVLHQRIHRVETSYISL